MTDERTLIEELREVDRLLPGLAVEPPPEALIEDVLARVKAETPLRASAPPKRRRGPPRWARIAAAVALLVGISALAANQMGWIGFGQLEIQGPLALSLFEPADAELDMILEEPISLDYSETERIRERIEAQMDDQRPAVAYDPSPEPTPSPSNQRRGAPARSRNLDGLLSLGYTTTTAEPPPPPVRPEQPGSESYAHTTDQAWTRVADDPLSTFSIDVDTASYANVRRFLVDGRLPPTDAVRIEEMLNYFSYEYDPPNLDADVPFSVVTEVGPAPWAPEHKLVHVGLQAAALPADRVPPRNLVFLLDVSGSMNNSDKLPLLKRGLKMMVPQLRAEDRVAIVVYAGAAGVVLEPTAGNEHSTIVGALDRLSAGGSTHGSAGIALAYDLARSNFRDEGINRVLLATDGDFNVGTTSHADLIDLIERERDSGVFLTVLGFGTGNLKDSTMESIADHGNGNYAYIDSPAEAHKVLVAEAGSTLVTVAKDVKIQVEFNPATVEGYRLIGYANRKLAHRDFTDDTKDAGEVGAGHSVTALYEVVPVGGSLPDDVQLRYQRDKEPTAASSGSDELMFVKVRYKKPDGRVSTEASWSVQDRDVRLPGTSDDFRFSAAIAGWGMLLRGSPYVAGWTLNDPADLAGSALRHDPNGYRSQAMQLMDKAASLATVNGQLVTGRERR